MLPYFVYEGEILWRLIFVDIYNMFCVCVCVCVYSSTKVKVNYTFIFIKRWGAWRVRSRFVSFELPLFKTHNRKKIRFYICMIQSYQNMLFTEPVSVTFKYFLETKMCKIQNGDSEKNSWNLHQSITWCQFIIKMLRTYWKQFIFIINPD